MAQLDHWDPLLVQSGQSPSDQFCDWVAGTGAFHMEGSLWVVESFTITAQTARKSPQPEPMEVIGVLKFLARRAGVRYEAQGPGAAKNFVTDAQLRKIGLYKKGEDHARDAIRHLVLGICSFGVGQLREELLQSLA